MVLAYVSTTQHEIPYVAKHLPKAILGFLPALVLDIEEGKWGETLRKINALRPNLKFTIDLPIDNSMAYLDTKTSEHKEDGSMKTD